MRILGNSMATAGRDALRQLPQRKPREPLDLTIGFACQREVIAKEDNDVIAPSLVEVGIHTKQAQCPWRCAEFLIGFTAGRLLQRFPSLHLAAGQIPVTLISVPHQQNFSFAQQKQAHANRDRVTHNAITQTVSPIE